MENKPQLPPMWLIVWCSANPRTAASWICQLAAELKNEKEKNDGSCNVE